MAFSQGRVLGKGLVAWLLWIALSTTAAAQSWHEDAQYGFKLQPPRGWKPIPLKAEENWLVAKFLCDQKDRWTDGDGGWTWEHQPELMVIAFVQEAIEKADKRLDDLEERLREQAEKEKEKEKEEGEDDGGEEGGDDEESDEKLVLTRPYRDYEDYLDRIYQGGGFYIASREEGVSNDLQVTKLEIKVEKLTYNGPKRVVTWIFHAPGVDFAVQTEVLETEFSKHKNTIQNALRSFRSIPRTGGPLATEATAEGSVFISFAALRKGTPEERKKKRLESELALHARAKKSLPPGWQSKEHKRFLLVFNTDVGFVDKVVGGAEGLLAWAEQNLAFIGNGEYVRRPILRVCATRAEKESLQRGVRNSGSWNWDSGLEIVTCKDEYGASGWQMDQLNRALLEHWLMERDAEVNFGMPEWVQHGLSEFVADARFDGKKVDLKHDDWDWDDFREVVQQKKHIPVRELVQMSQSEFYSQENNYEGLFNRIAQADYLVRFLLSPEAARSKQTKTLLFDYLEHLHAVVAELEQADVDESEAEPKTEEEEEALYKEKHAAWQTSEREREVLKRTFQRAFAGWDSKDWEAFERAFLKFAN